MPNFVHQTEAHRYNAIINGNVVASLQYSMAGKKLVIEHTDTVNDLRGQGIARRLTRHVFDDARTRGLVVDPKCSYAKRFVDQHPEYGDVL